MRRPLPGNGFAPDTFWRRIDRACARMIPYLVVIAVGLTLLNLIVLAVGSWHLPVTRRSPGMARPGWRMPCSNATGRKRFPIRSGR